MDHFSQPFSFGCRRRNHPDCIHKGGAVTGINSTVEKHVMDRIVAHPPLLCICTAIPREAIIDCYYCTS